MEQSATPVQPPFGGMAAAWNRIGARCMQAIEQQQQGFRSGTGSRESSSASPLPTVLRRRPLPDHHASLRHPQGREGRERPSDRLDISEIAGWHQKDPSRLSRDARQHRQHSYITTTIHLQHIADVWLVLLVVEQRLAAHHTTRSRAPTVSVRLTLRKGGRYPRVYRMGAGACLAFTLRGHTAASGTGGGHSQHDDRSSHKSRLSCVGDWVSDAAPPSRPSSRETGTRTSVQPMPHGTASERKHPNTGHPFSP